MDVTIKRETGGIEGHLRVKENGCEYKERDRGITEHFINGMKDDEMMRKMIKNQPQARKLMK